MTKPEPGDKVRVIYEGVYTRYGTVLHPSRLALGFDIPSGSTVEVIEPADDPSKDPIGTVRRSPNGILVACSDAIDHVSWVVVGGGSLTDKWAFDHRDVADWEKLSPVDGTAAAVADR